MAGSKYTKTQKEQIRITQKPSPVARSGSHDLIRSHLWPAAIRLNSGTDHH